MPTKFMYDAENYLLEGKHGNKVARQALSPVPVLVALWDYVMLPRGKHADSGMFFRRVKVSQAEDKGVK